MEQQEMGLIDRSYSFIKVSSIIICLLTFSVLHVYSNQLDSISVDIISDSLIVVDPIVEDTIVADTIVANVSAFPVDSFENISLAPVYLDTKKSPKNIYEQPYSLWTNYPNYKRLGINTGVMFGGAIAAAGILWVMPESFSNWDKDDIKEKGIFGKWKENVKAGPVWDEDDFFLNYVTHPYSGAIYYMSARSAGFNVLYSFIYSAFLSTCFWEYGIEAFAEVPSKQDLIITPVGGAILGEGFYLIKRSIVGNDYRLLNSKALGHTVTFLVDPISEIMDLCTGKFSKKKNTSITYSSQPILPMGGERVYGMSFTATF